MSGVMSRQIASRFSSASSKSFAPMAGQKRFLNLHEWQSLAVFSKFGVGVPKNDVLHDMKEYDMSLLIFH